MNKKKLLLPGMILLLAALLNAGVFFLPYVSTSSEYRETLESMGDTKISSDSELTYADLEDISLFEYARISILYGETFSSTAYKWIYGIVYSSVGVISVLLLLAALAKKPVLTLLLDALSAGIIHLVNWDLTDRGIISGGETVWGIAHYLYYPVLAVIAAGAIWLFAAKRKEKKTAGAAENQNL